MATHTVIRRQLVLVDGDEETGTWQEMITLMRRGRRDQLAPTGFPSELQPNQANKSLVDTARARLEKATTDEERQVLQAQLDRAEAAARQFLEQKNDGDFDVTFAAVAQ